jgi:vitamin B12 transporter
MSMFRKLLPFTLLFAAMQSQAQDSTKTKQLDEVVVTATKYPVKLSETGKVVTVVTHEQIEKSHGKSLAQILTEQTGILVNGANSSPGKDKSIFIRGASNKYTLILLDGVPVNDPAGFGGAFDLRLFPVDQIDHIEILKGSQSTLYGSDAIAGVINIISRKPGKKPIGFNGGATYGSFNSFNGNAGINGHTNIVDYNVNYNYEHTDGISDALDTTNKAGFDRDGYTRHSIQSNLTIRAGKNLKISPYYRYSLYDGGFDADAFTDGKSVINSMLNNAGAIATYTLPHGTITANYGYSYSKRKILDQWGTTFYRGQFNSGEIYLVHDLIDKVKFMAGANYQTYRLLDTTLDKKDPQTNIVSPYLSFFIQDLEGFSLEVGGRYNNHSEFGDRLTYNVSASYLIDGDYKIFANVSSGFKAPTVNDLFGPIAFGSNPNLKPETSNNFEAGTQFSAVDKKLQVTATGFYRDIKNLITYVGTRLINIDKQKDKGFELDATVTPNDKWTVKASYMYVTGDLHQSRNGKDTSFYNLVRRPKHTVTGTVGYQATKQLYIALTAQSLGKRNDLYFDPITYASSQVTLKAYTLLNAYAEYKLMGDKLRLFADAKNITDTKYTEVYGYNTPGFTINGGFRINL